MALRTTISIPCKCGFIGKVKRTENDQPMSVCWERFTPVDLIGNEHYVDGFADADEVSKAMNLKCPKCNLPLKLRNTQR